MSYPPPVTDLVSVSAIMQDHATTAYRFRIRNDGSEPVMMRLAASNSAAGWTAQIADADGAVPLDDLLAIPGDGSVMVIVRVTAPSDARPGDQNKTTLAAVAAESER